MLEWCASLDGLFVTYLDFRTSFLPFRCVSQNFRRLAEAAASDVLGHAGFSVVSDQLRHSHKKDFVAVLASHVRAVRAVVAHDRWIELRDGVPRGIESYAFRCELFRPTSGAPFAEMPLFVVSKYFEDTFVLSCRPNLGDGGVRARVFCEINGERAVVFDAEFDSSGVHHVAWFLDVVNERYPAWKRFRYFGRDDPFKNHGQRALVSASFREGELQFEFLIRSSDKSHEHNESIWQCRNQNLKCVSS